jgi:predicted nucleic acid-binding protein
MTSAVLDTNVVVQSLFSTSRNASRQVLDAYFEGRFRPQFSEATLKKLLGVLALPRIREKHGKSDEEVLEFITPLLASGDRHEIRTIVPASVTRDVTDA